MLLDRVLPSRWRMILQLEGESLLSCLRLLARQSLARQVAGDITAGGRKSLEPNSNIKFLMAVKYRSVFMFITKHPAELANLRVFKDGLDRYLQKLQIPAEKIQDIELAVEELLVNVMLYGYPEISGDIELRGEDNEQELIFQIIDQGVPFDPTSVASPELDGPIENRIQGGMGIYLAKSLVDGMKYQRCENKNILTLIIKKQLMLNQS